ncbi:hypothetical protein [Herpetosiphon sp. NSE202]|uniref:hypothetical protein n=1 Tax=Herpetosiphon sp. NSE202 TaxID=3351349 RepID=UPI003631334B
MKDEVKNQTNLWNLGQKNETFVLFVFFVVKKTTSIFGILFVQLVQFVAKNETFVLFVFFVVKKALMTRNFNPAAQSNDGYGLLALG